MKILGATNIFLDILQLLLALAVIALVMYLCYIFTKYIGKKMNDNTKFNNIKIIEQVSIGQDKNLIISEICGKYYLIGASNQSIEILSELEDVNTKAEENQLKNDFIHILGNAMKSKKHNTDSKNEEDK